MTHDKRRHKRFRSDLMELYGKMILAQKVEIIDISLSGVALKTDRKLTIGREYPIRLVWKGKTLDVWGVVVRSELIGIEEGESGKNVSTYAAGMMFKDASSNTVADFINSIEWDKKEAVSVMVDKRLNVRFDITTPCEKTLSFPTQFKVKEISLSGILIETEQPLGMESMIPMWLSLKTDKQISFIGRVASCQMREVKGQAHFEIGMEFKDLTNKDITLLNSFIDYLSMIEIKTDTKKTANEVAQSVSIGALKR